MIVPVGCLYLNSFFVAGGFVATGGCSFPVTTITPPGPLFDPVGFFAKAAITPGGAASDTMTLTVASVGVVMIGVPTIVTFLPKLIVVSVERFFPWSLSVYCFP